MPLKSYLNRLYDHAVRLAVRSASPYATHIPVLAGISVLCRPAKVIEFGSGDFSTALFLDRSVFPSVNEVVSFENSSEWAARVAADLGYDLRLHMQHVSGELAFAITPRSLAGDLIFIDDAPNQTERARTVRAVAKGCPDSVPVVVHDAELWRLRWALRAFEHCFVFSAMNPQTAVAWNGNSHFWSSLPALARILTLNKSHIEPTCGSAWHESIREDPSLLHQRQR